MPVDDVNVLVTFYSRQGVVERIAVWLAEGAVQAGARIRLRRARDIEPEAVVSLDPEWMANRDRMHEEFAAPTEADAVWADVLALGTPMRSGGLSLELEAYLDRLNPEELKGKIGTGFTSGYLQDEDSESAREALAMAMAELGLTVVEADSEPDSVGVADWDLAHAQGHTVVAIARAMKLKKADGSQ